MSIKNRVEALLLASNRPLSQKDLVELMEIDSKEDESLLLTAIYKLQEEYKSLSLIHI